MKVKEFINREDVVDVYDNVCEELGIAFCGPLKLTAEGKRHFAEVLEYDIDVCERCLTGVVDVDGPNGVWERKLSKAKEFFDSAAGFCSSDDWDRWFKE